MAGWLPGWLAGYLAGWLAGWIDGWIDSFTHSKSTDAEAYQKVRLGIYRAKIRATPRPYQVSDFVLQDIRTVNEVSISISYLA